MTTITATSAAEAAATWWTEKISGRVFHDNGDDSINGGVAGIMMGMITSREPEPGDDQFENFKTELTAEVNEILERDASWRERPWASLGTDYGPERPLALVAERCGIPFSRFPWKTHMSVCPDYVTVSDGYARPSVLIWQSPTWVRPLCGSQRYDDATGSFQPGGCGKLKFHDGDHGDWRPQPLCKTCGDPHDFSRHHPDKGYEDHPHYHTFIPGDVEL